MSHPRFAVTAGAIITDKQRNVLLLKHRFRGGSGWGMPGGYLAKSEQPEQALRRELREEAGLEVDNVKLFLTRTFKKPQQVEIIFTCRAVGDVHNLNYEIEESRWFTLIELPNGLPDDQTELIKDALSDGATQHG